MKSDPPFKLYATRAPRTLTDEQLQDAARLQHLGYTVGDMAVLHRMSIREVEPLLGIVRNGKGTVVYTGVWRSPLEAK